jgi:hypothetical protein
MCGELGVPRHPGYGVVGAPAPTAAKTTLPKARKATREAMFDARFTTFVQGPEGGGALVAAQGEVRGKSSGKVGRSGDQPASPGDGVYKRGQEHEGEHNEVGCRGRLHRMILTGKGAAFGRLSPRSGCRCNGQAG